jgi:hypothetical protein
VVLTKARRKAYKAILASLRDNPELWSFGSHEATCGNMKVWVQNRYYGTKFSVGSIHQGEINPFWALLPWEWWRVRIVRAVENAQDKMEFS